jgi:hypothetical protein
LYLGIIVAIFRGYNLVSDAKSDDGEF